MLVISQATQDVDMVVLDIDAWEARTTVTRSDARWVLPAGEPGAEHLLCVKTHPARAGKANERTLLAVVEHPGRILGIYPVRPEAGVDLDPRSLLEDLCAHYGVELSFGGPTGRLVLDDHSSLAPRELLQDLKRQMRRREEAGHRYRGPLLLRPEGRGTGIVLAFFLDLTRIAADQAGDAGVDGPAAPPTPPE